MSGWFHNTPAQRRDMGDIIGAVNKQTTLHESDVREIIQLTVEQIRDEIASGNVVTLQSIGSFHAVRDCTGKPRVSFMESRSMRDAADKHLPRGDP